MLHKYHKKTKKTGKKKAKKKSYKGMSLKQLESEMKKEGRSGF